MDRFHLPDEARLAGQLAGWVFAHLSFALPVDRLIETPEWIAFYHPKPCYPLHILLVPKKAIANLSAIDPNDSGLISGLIEIVQLLVKQLDLQNRGYRLITNGGPYQSIQQLHFHLISEK